MFTPEQIAQLQAKLDGGAVKDRTQGGRKVQYIEGWHAIAEANRIFGFDKWDRETISLTETNRDIVDLVNNDGVTYQQWRVGYLAKVRITVDGIVREGTGYGSGMARPEALGDAVESAAKEAETDAMKRALMTFGNPFGLALYDKTRENVEPVARNAPQRPLEARPGPPTMKRLSSAMAKEKALHTQIKDAIWGCTTQEELDFWEAHFDEHTAEAPLSWLDSIRNDVLIRRKEIRFEQGDAELDDAFRETVRA